MVKNDLKQKFETCRVQIGWSSYLEKTEHRQDIKNIRKIVFFNLILDYLEFCRSYHKKIVQILVYVQEKK